MWLAARLGMSLQRCQQETTAREFNKWLVWLNEEKERIEVDEYYWANIAMWIAKTNAKHPDRVRVEDFLFRRQSKTSHASVSKEQRIKEAHSYWDAFFKVYGAVKKGKG